MTLLPGWPSSQKNAFLLDPMTSCGWQGGGLQEEGAGICVTTPLVSAKLWFFPKPRPEAGGPWSLRE